jgi:hypothetical protein
MCQRSNTAEGQLGHLARYQATSALMRCDVPLGCWRTPCVTMSLSGWQNVYGFVRAMTMKAGGCCKARHLDRCSGLRTLVDLADQPSEGRGARRCARSLSSFSSTSLSIG